MKKFFPTIICLLLCFLFLVLHLSSLSLLPVFADESIYIRWTQLIIDDWRQYLFFPLNDGKTPLHMWAMIPFQFIFSDQLYAGRFLSVFVGLFQAIVMSLIMRELGGKKKAQVLTFLFVSVLPFWFFHHRMAIIDGLLTLLLSVSVLFTVKGVFHFDRNEKNKAVKRFLVAGMFFGLSLLTKLPSILFAPIYFFLIFLSKKEKLKNYLGLWFYSFVILSVGLALFLLLKLHPAFGQLFSRGGDFLFSTQEILAGEWKQSFKNVGIFMGYFSHYLTFPIILFSFSGLFLNRIRKKQAVLLASAFIFLLPIILMGKIVYPRYLMPASIFFTLTAVLSFDELIRKFVVDQKKLLLKFLSGLILLQLLSYTLVTSFSFIVPSLTNASLIPFAKIDQHQYLYDWSSGHGIVETVELIKKEAQNNQVLVLTEGYFGTLPDALLMYFHRQNVDNIFIQGIGQPVSNIPTEMIDKSKDFDSIWLVLNSHRLNINLDENNLIAEYCRPDDNPCLQIWKLNDYIHDLNK